MRWSIIASIAGREIREQLRDRRTLFMVFGMPILLYPLLGFGILQLSVAVMNEATTVLVVGVEHLPSEPRLYDADLGGFAEDVCPRGQAPGDLRVIAPVNWDDSNLPDAAPEQLQDLIRNGLADAILLIPPGTSEAIAERRPAPLELAYTTSYESSQLVAGQVREALNRWNAEIVGDRLHDDGLPGDYTRAIDAAPRDLAEATGLNGLNLYARLFPFLLVIMCLTGTFYPAVDVGAGEKERGTMETLLIAPAHRSEIVLGKFLTVALAGAVSAVLNLVSMGLTSWRLVPTLSAVPGGSPGMTIATPSAGMVLWMLLLLIPLAALFAAVCLALSVVARSMKEAQYYLTPVYMITLPLVFLSLAPGLKIDLFHSLVPVTGVSLLLRSLLLGEYDLARPYAPVVLVSTCTYALIALQIAVERFKDESVLFRDSERFSPVDWLRHLIRDRGSRPASLHALTCFAIMVALAWFLSVGAAPGVATLIVSQLGFILLPPVVMAWLFTSEPMKTLRLRWPRGVYLLLGPLLAVALNPAIREVALWVEWAFPVPEAVAERLDAFFATIPNAGMMLLVLALLPAICEEVAFRGYILSGLQRGRRTIIAVLISAVLFGFMHVLLSLSQQVVVSLLLGLLLGYLAIRSGSLLPGILFHLTSNGLNVVLGRMAESASEPTVTSWLFRDLASGRYHEVWVLGGLACAALPIYWLVGPASERGGGGQSGEPGAFGTPQVDDSDRELT